MEEQIKSKPNLVEMAKRRRHLHLVEKLAKGKSTTPTLSKTEINELKQYEGDPGSPGIVDSLEKVSRVFGVAARTVDRWVKDGMPIAGQNKYDLLEIRAWREIRKSKKTNSKKQNSVETRRNLADAIYREHKAKLAELALKKAIGELLLKDTVERELMQISAGIKRRLLAIPGAIAAQLVGLNARQINVLLNTRIKEAIQDIFEGKIFAQKVKNVKINIEDLDRTG